jgi:hypothetical protein
MLELKVHSAKYAKYSREVLAIGGGVLIAIWPITYIMFFMEVSIHIVRGIDNIKK